MLQNRIHVLFRVIFRVIEIRAGMSHVQYMDLVLASSLWMMQ